MTRRERPTRRLWARAQVAPFELAIALLLVLSGFRFLWKEDELQASQIGQTLFWPQLWAAGYMVAGLLVLAGVLVAISRVEAAGLALMVSVVAVNALAFAATYNIWSEWQFGVAFLFYLSLALAALGRLLVLLRGGLLIVRSQDEPEILLGADIEERDRGS